MKEIDEGVNFTLTVCAHNIAVKFIDGIQNNSNMKQIVTEWFRTINKTNENEQEDLFDWKYFNSIITCFNRKSKNYNPIKCKKYGNIHLLIFLCDIL
jgi:hypothetical protein